MNQSITLQRKQDTRKKIQLGGLVIKAGLANETPTLLLGLLVDAAERLQSSESEKIRKHFQALGDVFFSASMPEKNADKKEE